MTRNCKGKTRIVSLYAYDMKLGISFRYLQFFSDIR